MLPSVVIALLVVAADVRAIAPKPRVYISEIGIFILSVVVGIMLLWLALALFEVGYFTPFILGLGGRGLNHIHAFTLSSEGSVAADRDFVGVFGGYLLVAGFASVPLGGGVGLIGYVSRWVHRLES